MTRYISTSVIDCLKQEYTKRKFEIIISISCCSHKNLTREIERRKERRIERRIERKKVGKKEEIGLDIIKENERDKYNEIYKYEKSKVVLPVPVRQSLHIVLQ